jgi:lycopene beta-cyclase
MKTDYDIIIAGGGVAGLSLAHRLALGPLRGQSMLVADRSPKDRNDRTLSFWTDHPTPFDAIVCRSWSRLRFVSDGFARELPLGAYRYCMLRGLDLYQFVHEALAQQPGVEQVRGVVDAVEDSSDGASVVIDGRRVTGRWVFDSRFTPAAFRLDPARTHALWQHFTGWVVETATPAFDPDAATMFDLRTPQEGELRFFYTLPFSEQRALVEYVTLSPARADEAVRRYLDECLGLRDYRIAPQEGGLNPLTDYVFPRRLGAHVMAVGTLGGRVKPTSGYAFARILRDSEAIAGSLERCGHPFDVPAEGRLYRILDSALLDVMQRRGEQAKPILEALFRKNSAGRIFRFLDEETSPVENVRLAASLPFYKFGEAFFRMFVLNRI